MQNRLRAFLEQDHPGRSRQRHDGCWMRRGPTGSASRPRRGRCSPPTVIANRLPLVERTELFARSIGNLTDSVEKEMYLRGPQWRVVDAASRRQMLLPSAMQRLRSRDITASFCASSSATCQGRARSFALKGARFSGFISEDAELVEVAPYHFFRGSIHREHLCGNTRDLLHRTTFFFTPRSRTATFKGASRMSHEVGFLAAYFGKKPVP